jgi:hypothetical protein
MQLPKWLGYVAMIATILTNLTAEAGKIKPVYGVITAFAAGLLALFTKSVMANIISLGHGVTIAGVVLVAGSIASFAAGPAWTDVIGAGHLQFLSSLGAMLSIIGAGLKVGPSQTLPDNGGNTQ